MASFVDELTVVGSSGLHADGVFTVAPISAGALAFKEAPLNKVQSLDNRQDAMCCGQCLRFIGGRKMQLLLLTNSHTRAEISASVGSGSDAVDAGPNDLSPVVPCRDACGEVYCSTACATKHWESCHCLLCTGKIPDESAQTHPIMAFKIHACQTNEIFLMVADIFAGVVLRVEKGATPEEAMAPYEGYVREHWWDAVANPDPILVQKLKELVAQSWGFLSEALHLSARNLHSILDMDYFSQTIGMFEQNNVGIQLTNPVAAFAKEVSLMDSPSFDQDAAENVLSAAKTILLSRGGDVCLDSECEDEEESDEDEAMFGDDWILAAESVGVLLDAVGGCDDLVWPPLSGAAFYSKVCKINHSCEPNVMVTYATDPEQGLVAQVEVLRDLAAGEELLHSYVDKNDDYETRAAALSEYGFECTCVKCQSRI
jgi:hypothetical protein